MNTLIAIIGHSDSGKTTLIENLIPELKRRGYRIGTVKHAHHPPDFDKIGKDSWRHFDAGADSAMVYADRLLAMVKHHQAAPGSSSAGLLAAAQYFDDVDLVLAEGFKSGSFPKIEVYRPADGISPLCGSVESVVAVVTDVEVDVPVKRFDFKQIVEIADLIEQIIEER